MTKNDNNHIDEAHQILISLGLPRGQHNERSALCLLALLNLTPSKTWAQVEKITYRHHTNNGLVR